MKVVTNAGPLIALGKLGLIHLLHALYGPVLVPQAVHDEVVTQGLSTGQPDAYAIQLAIARHELDILGEIVEESVEVVLPSFIDVGEKQAIEQGLHESVDLVLLDDLVARKEAQRLGLRVKGTLGILAEACRTGLLSMSETELVFRALLSREDIWISNDLVQAVWSELQDCDRGESSDE